MKSILLAACALIAFSLVAAEEATTKPTPKADKTEKAAKTKAKAKGEKAKGEEAKANEAVKEEAKPKAEAKPAAKKPAAKKPAAKKPVGFQPYDAGEWKEIDNRKGLMYGTKINVGDLHLQPVVICRFDPAVQITGEDRENHPEKYLRLQFGETEDFPPRFQIINVPSRELTKEEQQFIAKPSNVYKLSCVQGFPWYEDFGLQKEPSNPAKSYPFYYVVSSDGKVVYEGDNAQLVFSAMMRDCRKHEKCDMLLGYATVSEHAAIVEKMKFGEDTTKGYKKLVALAAAKEESDGKTEAQNLIWALDQSKTYWARVLAGLAGSNPPYAVVLGKLASKSFPRHKPVFEEYVQRALRAPGTAEAVKAYSVLLACKQKMPEKKAEIQKAYEVACNAEKKCIKARKQFGDKLPRAFINLENLVMTMKVEFETAGATPKKK